MPDTLVCPECGGSEFTATLTTRTKYTYSAYDGMAPLEEREEVVDGGGWLAVDEFACTECCTTYDDLSIDGGLVTESAYNEPCACEGSRGLDGCYDCT